MNRREGSAAHGLITRAELLRDAGRLEEARQVLRELFAGQPDHVGGRILLARIHADGGARRLAIGVLEEVLAGEPAQLQATLLLAQLLADEGQWREARVLLDQSGTLAPGDPRVAELRASLQQLTTLSKLRGADPFDRPSVAERLEQEGRYDSAREVWERLAGDHPDETLLQERLAALADREPEEAHIAPLRAPPGRAGLRALRRLGRVVSR